MSVMENIFSRARINNLTRWFIPAAAILVFTVWFYITPPGLLGKADAIGYAICHRIGERSFQIGDRQLPLCARCTGEFYAAGISLLALFPAARLPKYAPGELSADDIVNEVPPPALEAVASWRTRLEPYYRELGAASGPAPASRRAFDAEQCALVEELRPEVVQLATHRVSTTHRPSVDVMVNGARLTTVHCELSLVLEIEALTATVRHARLVALGGGRSTVTAVLAFAG